MDSPSSFTTKVGKGLPIFPFYWIKVSVEKTKSCAALQNGERGTVKPKSDFDAKDDAVALRKAIEGLGKNMTCIKMGSSERRDSPEWFSFNTLPKHFCCQSDVRSWP